MEVHGERWEQAVVKGSTLRRRSRKATTAVHLSFKEFEAVHLPFHLPIAPMLFHCGGYRFIVAFDSGDEALQFGDL